MTERQNRAYEYLLSEGFLPVGRESHSLFRRYYDEGDNMLQEMTAMICTTATAFAFTAVYKIVYEYLCSVWFYQDGEIYFNVQWPSERPEHSLAQVVDALYGISLGAGYPSLRIATIEERFLKRYEAVKGYAVSAGYNDNYSEYAYRTADLLELSGGVNLNKRNRLKKFFNKENVSVRPMTKENVRLCFEIEEKWCGRQDCAYCESFIGCEKKALGLISDIFDDTAYKGVFGYIDDVPEGYAIYEKKNAKVAFLFFGKANVSDLFVYLIYMMVKLYLSDVEYLNTGYDMGKAGLRTFKKHLSVHELWRKYLCIFTKTGETEL
ncbi:MAG: hypothetical protein LBQ88_20920 [Treponema sp.]|nr:hypothetical protein [Treponema sp.]